MIWSQPSYSRCRECGEPMYGILCNTHRHTCHECCLGGDGGQIIRDKSAMRYIYERHGLTRGFHMDAA